MYHIICSSFQASEWTHTILLNAKKDDEWCNWNQDFFCLLINYQYLHAYTLHKLQKGVPTSDKPLVRFPSLLHSSSLYKWALSVIPRLARLWSLSIDHKEKDSHKILVIYAEPKNKGSWHNILLNKLSKCY